jgi:RimJ/RimL family protein N-acetyltransferase
MGLYPATLNSIASFLGTRSFRRLFICVKSDNAESISGIEKAGFRRVGEVRLRKMLGIQISRPFSVREV